MKKTSILVVALLASLSFGFDWTFGLSGKCTQARKIIDTLSEKKSDEEREQAEKKALELCSGGAAGLYVKGLRHERAGRLDEAMEEYRACLKEDSSFTRARGNLGNIYYQKGMYDEAALEMTKALSDRE
ncbi:MAG: tetratricopeptide repeat protein, partial [Geobacteraceae bacterium]|nr:tetratricopeptide repeat protein [Geobacteraceae bacterium]